MQDKILVIDNIIPDDILQYMQKTVLREDLPWNLHLSTVTGASDSHQMVIHIQNEDRVIHRHLLHLFNDCIQPNLEKTLDKKVKTLLRCKLNLVSPTFLGNHTAHHQPHIDVEYDEIDENLYSCIFYLFDSDGPTYFFNENEVTKTIDPKANRAIVFHYNQLHASSSPRRTQMRIVMNAVFELE